MSRIGRTRVQSARCRVQGAALLKKLSLSLLLLISVIGTSMGQQRIQIKVIDAVSHETIANANIVSDFKGSGASSDQQGIAMVRVQQFPLLLTVSHISYHTKDVFLHQKPDDEVLVELIPATQQLEEVKITAEKYRQYTFELPFYVNSFTFAHSQIWVSGYPGKNILDPELRVLALSGERIAQIKTYQTPLIRKDAFGNIHVAYADSCFQLFLLGDTIVHLYGDETQNIERQVFSIRAIKGDTAILKQFNQDKTFCEFISIVKGDSLPEVIHASYNRELFPTSEAARRYRHERVMDVVAFPGPPGEGAELIELKSKPEYRKMNLHQIRDAEARQGRLYGAGPDRGRELTTLVRHFYTTSAVDRFLVFKPIGAQIMLLQNRFYVYEDAESLLWELDSDYELNNVWRIELVEGAGDLKLLQDEVQQTLYISYEVNGQYRVGRINTEPGKIDRTQILDGFTFINSIQVHDGKIYFIHQSAIGIRTMNLYSIDFD